MAPLRFLIVIALAVIVNTAICLSKPASVPGLKSLRTGKLYGSLSCKACEAAVFTVRELLKLHVSEDTIAKRLLGICELFKIEKEAVCIGAISEFKYELLSVLQKTDMSSADTCVLMFGTICQSSSSDPELQWNVDLPNTSKPHYKPPKPQPGSPTLRVLQLSDIHLDEKYAVGSNTDCGEPLCCRASNGAPSTSAAAAGYWGDYRDCDIPERTLDSLLNHIAKNEKFDMIYWTGDLPPHDVWQQTRTGQITLLQKLTDKLLKYFPKTPIYSVVGNHESAPVDSFPPPYITGNHSEHWLYNALYKTWSHWLPATTSQTVTYGAFYTVPVKKGLRLISLNTNFCDHMNWWLMLNVTDPAQELKWLIGVLQQAEIDNEKVHILGHIPPGDSTCYRVWSQNYHKIIVRYANTITAQFFGHTHYDHFQLFYDPETKKPVSVGYISPSVTTYSGLNPGYRIYTVDGDHSNSTWTVLDHETSFMNLTLANTQNKTLWQHEYSVKSVYNMTDLLPSSWHNYVESLHSDNTAFQRFYNHYYKMNTPGACDSTCKDSMLCGLQMATYGDRTYCSQQIKSPPQKMQTHERSLRKVC